DVQSLAGDSTDNVPGVPGMGLKTAGALIREVGDLDRALATESDDVELELADRLRELQEELDSAAGEPVKIGAGAQIAKVLMDTFGVELHELKKDKTGNISADTATIERLAEGGNLFCKTIVRARDVRQILTSRLALVRQHADKARVSRELVRLKDDVPDMIPADALGVHDPDPAELLGFLRVMEFNTLTRRIAEGLGAEPPAPVEVSVGSTVPTKGRAQPGVEKANGEAVVSESPAAGAAEAAAAARAPFDRSKYETVTTRERLEVWIMKAYAAGRFAFDTETTSIDPMVAELVGFSIAVAPGEACYVPLGHRASSGSFDFGTHDGIVQIPVGEALALLKPLLEEPSILKIGQNIKYDLNVLAQHGIKAAPLDDTMLMSYALDAGKGSHGMDDLAMRHLGHACISFDQVIAHVPGKKSERTFGQVPLDKATEYAAEDADVTLRLWMVLKPRLAAERLMTVYETLERPLIGVIAEMERCGILVDGAILSRLSSTFAQGVARLEEEVNRLVGHKFNLGSPRQLGELLFDRLQLPGGKRTKSGQWETRAGLLDDLAANEELPDDARKLINTMLEWRQLTKLRSTYTDALPAYVHGGTGRIHTSYALGATTTGRLASSEPNLQNIPIRTKEGREIRTAFVAAAGKKLISADYSQIELRVLAHMADIPQLRKAFDEGLDIHAMTASEMFGVPVEGMPADVRRRAKAINFGIIYGISAFGLANQLGIPKDEAGAYIKTYFERFPGIRAYMEDTKRKARERGFVETVFGRRIHYPEINTRNPGVRGNLERAAINAPIQGSAADIIRRAMVRMPGALASEGLTSARMLLQVHDELVFEVGEADVPKALSTVKNVMEGAALPVIALAVPIHVDAKAADNWEAAH
ncbi:MAG: DNA polymerase I, partial [Hyphomicrobium sp.]